MTLLTHKKARFDYTITDTYHAGIVLSGPEVKSLRNKSGSLTGSFVKIVGNEVFLLNAQISPYKFADNREYDPKRTRKLLLKRSEIDHLAEASQQKGITLVPLTIETVGNHIKVVVGVGRGKKVFEKRAVMKDRVIKRELEQSLKNKVRLDF